MAIRVVSVVPGSPADRAGILPDDLLLRLNGEDVLDEIDYQALTMVGKLQVELRRADGTERSVTIRKDPWGPLGLTLDETEILKPRVCHNHCVFCFVDQLPPGMRSTLYVRDDDWRLSLMMGNFVTLTNVDDQEFDRILRRKASPLYISVHATDPEVRVRMLQNPHAGNIMERLRAMKEHDLKFHSQVVLCPGLNDGQVLYKTIVDLASLWPACQSLAIVPVGVTGFRDRLTKLNSYDRDSARELLRDLELIRAYYLKALGTRFVYPADELYSLADLPLPSNEEYEGYPQIENGVGMLRLMRTECEDYLPELLARFQAEEPFHGRTLIPTGVSALAFIQGLVDDFGPKEESVEVFSVPNHFFGETVTVTGLIVGRDLIAALEGKTGDRILISESMLRENTHCFLDDMTVEEVEQRLGLPLRVVPNHGDSFLNALYGLEDQSDG